MRLFTHPTAIIEHSELFVRGKDVYIGENVRLIGKGTITIGNNTAIAMNTLIISDNHDWKNNMKETIPAPIIIGENCWIGANCIILGNTKIGNNCIIGAGSVVRRPIPNGWMAFGNPCELIKKVKL